MAAVGIQLIPVGDRRFPPLSSERYYPDAPVLRHPRYAGRAMPPEVEAVVDPASVGRKPRVKRKLGAGSAFDAPGGRFLVYLKGTLDAAFRPALLDGSTVRPLEAPEQYWPFPHDFSEDGRWLYLGYHAEVWRLDVASGRGEAVVSNIQGSIGPVPLGVMGSVLGLTTPHAAAFLPLDPEGPWQTFPNSFARAFARVCDRKVALSSATAGTQVFGVYGREVRPLARLPEVVLAAWEEQGRVYANLAASPPAAEHLGPCVEVLGLEQAWAAGV